MISSRTGLTASPDVYTNSPHPHVLIHVGEQATLRAYLLCSRIFTISGVTPCEQFRSDIRRARPLLSKASKYCLRVTTPEPRYANILSDGSFFSFFLISPALCSTLAAGAYCPKLVQSLLWCHHLLFIARYARKVVHGLENWRSAFPPSRIPEACGAVIYDFGRE